MTCIAFVGIGTRPCQPQPSRPHDAGSILVPPKSDGEYKTCNSSIWQIGIFGVHRCAGDRTIPSEWSANLTLGLLHVCPSSGRRRQRASKSGLSMFGLLDYRGWPRRRLHSPRAERMKVKPPSPPSAQSVQTKKKPPVDLAISP